ncbi:hypothetical protein ACFPTR_06205 [Aliibacillus thermotolerans]|uniref:Uncharacterized protein n=1 Tax=Aliibacillus thermotolerans TaxID=1834418 RepID=A0ABW0U5Q8_9BACI|nr:hypothetical protein [Aliibacillus thermotolerans]MDA3129471.1 hypothetical protein [Aliibacillus thermotolerans]
MIDYVRRFVLVAIFSAVLLFVYLFISLATPYAKTAEERGFSEIAYNQIA